MTTDSSILATIRTAARPIVGRASDLDPIFERCRGKRFILLGEASHGTHDFYAARAELTRRLVTQLGCAAVAVEADWPDAYRVNRYVRGSGHDGDAAEALEDFRRFPQWMWRNADVLDFVGWLRSFNDGAGVDARVGFYGLDLYSLHTSIEASSPMPSAITPPCSAAAPARGISATRT